MSGINSGILLNAVPLTALQIKELEAKIAETGEVFAYLNESGQICFAGNLDTELIKELAWHYTSEITSTTEAVTKKVYRKSANNTYNLDTAYTKAPGATDWQPISSRLGESCLDSFILS
jgi:hypothetical protein